VTKTTNTSFRVRAQDGRIFHIVETVELLSAASSDEPSATVEGLKVLRTTQGHAVNRVSAQDFEILGAGPLLESAKARRL